MKNLEYKKILLVLPPFWTPLIPPQGIAHLKSFLQTRGDYTVKTKDANIEEEFKEIYNRYFNTLKEYIPEKNRGNFYNIGHDVLRHHMMAYINRQKEKDYLRLVEILVYQTFFWTLPDIQVAELNLIIEEFFARLQVYFLGLLEEEKPDVVGLTAHLGTLASCMYAFKLTKDRNPRIMTVMGGTIFSGELPEDSPDFQFLLEKTPYIDKIIIGEGQTLMLKLLRGELPGTQRVFTLRDIGEERLDIGSIQLPDLADFNLGHYPYQAAFASSSCPHQCHFCNVAAFYGKYRKKNIPQVVEELEELYHQYGNQLYFMNDSLLNPIMMELVQTLIKQDLSFYLDGYLRVDDQVGNIENTILWRRGGLYRARIGIETGSQRLLDLMGKKITIAQIMKAISSLAHAGIKTTIYCVIGYPGETEADFRQTLDLIEKLKNDIWEAESNPFYYYYSGQPKADKWAKQRVLLYPPGAQEMLISQTWVLECQPSREERFRRLSRFVEHCKKLGIPNPYSINDIYKADERWKKLHTNAVPSLVEIRENPGKIRENRQVENLCLVRDNFQEEGDFGF